MDIVQWLDIVTDIESVRFIPVNHRIAVKSVALPGEFHKDPADRLIVATARDPAAPLITADEKIGRYAHVATIWKRACTTRSIVALSGSTKRRDRNDGDARW